MSILQQSPIIVAPAVSMISTSSRKADEEPQLPAEFDHGVKAAVKAGRAWTEEQISGLDQFRADHAAWHARMAKKGKGYSPDTVRNLSMDAQAILMDYLELTGAPEEIKTIAKWNTTAENIWARYYFSWNALDDYAAARVAQFVPALRQAIKVVRFFLNAAQSK